MYNAHIHVYVHVHLALLSSPSGDYDAVNVIMLLPRIVFKAELIIDQLKQQVRLLNLLLFYHYNLSLSLSLSLRME